MQTAPPITITSIVSEFLGAAPSLDEIIAFRLPDELKEQGLQLLSLSREGRLSEGDSDIIR